MADVSYQVKFNNTWGACFYALRGFDFCWANQASGRSKRTILKTKRIPQPKNNELHGVAHFLVNCP